VGDFPPLPALEAPLNYVDRRNLLGGADRTAAYSSGSGTGNARGLCPRGDLNPETGEISLNLDLNSKAGEKSPDRGVHAAIVAGRHWPASIRHRRLAAGRGLRVSSPAGDDAFWPSWCLHDLPALTPDRARLGVLR
jgi:hypothetical protein